MTAPDVRVTDRAVYFDGWELPWFIAKDGIEFKPGGHDDVNRLTVEFLVGTTTFLGTREGYPWVVYRDEHVDTWWQTGFVVELDYELELAEFDRIMKEYI
ncbi:hypothetical protein MycrhDRAFT_5783 [Mycolicibacterium rhodesiae JS60]|nr:hypothetical protein MycrhDRAFT_5783 [Mycolicibacterium rhodesiae JS60]